MQFSKTNVFTPVTAGDIPPKTILSGVYGYFAHDLASLRTAVTEDRTTSRCQYGRLTGVTADTNRARFILDKGDYIFTLFYPTDNFLNTNRY